MMQALAIIAGVAATLWLTQRRFVAWVARDWYRGPVSDHFDGQRFTNPAGPAPHHGSRAMFKWKATSTPAVWPKSLPVTRAKPAARVHGGALVATMVGHATVLVQTQGLNILTDPVWSQRTSPLQWIGPKRVRAPGIVFDDLPKIDIVLLSHNHYDHLDLATLKRLWARDRPTIITPLGNAGLLARHGVAVTETDWGDGIDVAGLRIHCDRVQHWSSRWGLDSFRALWSGFTVELPGGNLFFAGDCGYRADAFAAIARHGRIRLALLPVGAYEPRWFMAYHHMNPADAVQAFVDLGAECALGIHWGVWQLTDEAIDAPREALDVALDAAGVARARFRAGVPGDVLVLPELLAVAAK